ncbi:MAG: hypothetical protein MAG551_00781 [Candidatus Scalindua arabica]|uniref:Uncharacterized protein n=1 Tax=Candidatus Scalindua arabica TaxID=1127984 RepID=A0A941W130_9BACT|nr:hypothetical protein [Candidatus Scalindua arabica]
MKKDKLLLSKTTKLMFSSTFVSIVVSMCLIVNLFAPGFSTVIKGKRTALQSEYHTCKCNSEPHSIDDCCCAIELDASEGKSIPKISSQGVFSTFIQSLACAGIPDRFTPISYNVSLPEGSVTSPRLFFLHYWERVQTPFPASAEISPPDKPPRIT